MKKASKKTLIRKNDKLWSQIIHARSDGRCEHCGKYGNLNAHHVFIGRANKHTRWSLKNGLGVAIGCHFKAHNSPALFYRECRNYIGKETFEGNESDVLTTSMDKSKLTVEGYQNINTALKSLLEEYSK